MRQRRKLRLLIFGQAAAFMFATIVIPIEVVFANHGPLELFDRLSDFNELVAELRETQSQLVED